MRILIFLSFLISLTGCVKSNPDLNQIIKGNLASQLALWKKKGVSNYEMTMKISCYCIQGRVGPHHIIVENDKIKTVNNLPYDSTKTGPILTINELFDFIIISLAKNPYQHFLDYNAIFHYPKYIYFDFSQQIADDEVGYEIIDFKAS